MLADQLEAKAVQRANAGGVEQGQLLGQAGGFHRRAFEPVAQALAHFGGGGLREGHHEKLIDASGVVVVQQPGEAPLDQRARFARPRARHHQDIAPRGGGFQLLRG